MSAFSFDAAEFAKLEYLLNRLVGFHHQHRSAEELQRFSTEIYPLLREVTYEITGSKISEDQYAAISEANVWPPHEPSSEDGIELLRDILSKR